MGLFGRGIAFNNCFIRRMPLRPQIMRGPVTGLSTPISFSFQESFSYKTNGWDFMNTLLQTFAMTTMMWGGWGTSRAGAATTIPQGTTEQKGEDKFLQNLIDFRGKNYIIKAHPSKNGIYQAVKKDGTGDVIEGTYDQLMDELGCTGPAPKEEPKIKEEEPKEEPKVKEEEPKEEEPKSTSRKGGGGSSPRVRGGGGSGSAQKPIKTIKGNNGYFVEIYKDGTKKYFDNLGNPTGETEFAHHCPNIHASVTKNDPVNKAEEAKYKSSPQKVSIQMNVSWSFGKIRYTASGFIRDFKGNKIPISVKNIYDAGLQGLTEKGAMTSAIADAGEKLKDAGRKLGYTNLSFNFPKA